MTDVIRLKKGEGRWVGFSISRGGAAVDVGNVPLTFAIKAQIDDTAYILKKEDGDFDKTDAVNGKVRVNIPAGTTKNMAVGEYVAELRTEFVPDEDVDKGPTIPLFIESAVIGD